MRFFAKCISVFIGLTILLTIGSDILVDLAIPLSATILFSAFIALILTMIYGWIEAVYIEQRQPGLGDD